MYWFMSFRDVDLDLNLGCCIIKADSGHIALQLSHQKEINPGGELYSYGMNEEQFEEQGMELNHLYSRAEMIELGFDF